MNDTDKVVIALGFFTLVGFIVFIVYAMSTGGAVGTTAKYVTVAELKQARQEMRSGR